MTPRYPDTMTAAGTQARIVRDATDGEQRAVVHAVLRRVQRHRLDPAGARQVLEVLGLLDTATAMTTHPPAPDLPARRAPVPTHGSKALAHAAHTRRTELGLSRAEVARRGGPQPRTLRHLEQGRPGIKPDTQDRLDHALGWAPGTTARILGGTP